ncbi:hypothetical protein SJ05684_c20770 [Sinorhizobium sojae CCBAU 05684]|uniref:Uncharacterized protein n=1 Tax=Sinorhizobium sojae CCBAU 05684 TaxID=716928 RepID=A0A249PC75_9HYPH|nr:hypothetical protein [Sinorhizobium sojae]ASY63518.1 hypothetical protein SJ05684_c20770 [Sinorhizobium sojae CCBAU 05684]
MDLLRWISGHGQLISALTGVGMLLVWVIYLQVFISSYRRQLRATLLIARGAGDGLEARCFLSNMSSGPVYVQSVIITLETADGTLIRPATDIQDGEGSPIERTRQGPLQPGDIRDIGSFRSLICHALEAADDQAEIVQAMVIEILGVYGSEDLPVGARRRFILAKTQGRIRLRGDTIETQQIRKRRERRRLISELKRDQ